MSKLIKTEGNTPADMIRIAVAGGADLDKLEKLLTLQERWEANEARKAYHQSMADFKANPPKIAKDKKVSFGNTRYNHASLFNVVEKITKELSKHGLSASWSTKQNGAISVTCKITHVKGHTEETTLTADADTSGSKNSIQSLGSAITYLERYTLLAATGLAPYDQDDDGAVVNSNPITDKQLSALLDILDNLPNADDKKVKFLKYMAVSDMKDIPSKDYEKGMQALKAAQEKKK